MKASIVVRSKDEADRLRLVLASLAHQTMPVETVIVDDGSSDHTQRVIADASREMDLVALRHERPLGRSAASNAGAAAASGDIVVFLDGDTLAAPDFAAQHLARHCEARDLVVRGETWHLRGTRPLLDPEAGTPQPDQEARVARMSAAERAQARVTRSQIAQAFDAIASRGQPGVYPGFGPRRLFEVEMEGLRLHPDCPVLWAAASGSNQSAPRERFLAVGGFVLSVDITAHRELALRLCKAGCRMAATEARSYHMIHRAGWRDPLADRSWEAVLYEAHPIAAVALMPLLWETLDERSSLPARARLHSLPALADAAQRTAAISGRDAVRRAYLDWARAETP